jgi:hypothetical protein
MVHTPDGSLQLNQVGGIILFILLQLVAGVGKDAVGELFSRLGDDCAEASGEGTQVCIAPVF